MGKTEDEIRQSINANSFTTVMPADLMTDNNGLYTTVTVFDFQKALNAFKSEFSSWFKPNPLFVNTYVNDPDALAGGYEWSYDEFNVPIRVKDNVMHDVDYQDYLKRQKYYEDDAQQALAKGKPFGMVGIRGGSSPTPLRPVSLTSFEEVAGHIRNTGKLPQNFITKEEAIALGWDASQGNLAQVAPGKSIGGNIFLNKGKPLPDAPGRVWYEADINYIEGFRGNERIIYSNDGLIYKTTDHYKTFIQIP